ncbi:PIN domain-containing protein [Gracilinema caldarium]|uniref:PIN domain-containing protein n=1 Tax=Gracilinema caldarium TaxID=215591 RepID=UPI0026E929A5|nr:PIN domain-containing protein [Gracilinema caldarium]
MSKIFIDTNLIVYTLDKSNVDKQERARNIIRKIVDVHQPVISTQVIKEFYVVAINKMKADPIIVKNIIHNFRNMEIVTNDLELIEQAIDISVISQISFWDSLIIAAAEKANCEYIFSEDLNPGQTYRGVLVVNPFETGDKLF